MARKKQSGGGDGGGGSPAWMATYADLVTLLFALFVMMFAFSEVDAARVEAMAQAMRGGGGGGARRLPQVSANFGGEGINTLIGNGITNMPIATLVAQDEDREARTRQRQQELSQMASEFRTYFADRNLQEAVIVQEGENYVLLRFADGVLFDSGRADLRPEALEALGAIANQLEGLDDIEIMIEGHTDNIPISTARFRDNLDLSQARSAEVWRYFVNNRGMDPTSIGAIGLSEYRPIADNNTPEGRQANRRVEMRIMSGSFDIASAMHSIP